MRNVSTLISNSWVTLTDVKIILLSSGKSISASDHHSGPQLTNKMIRYNVRLKSSTWFCPALLVRPKNMNGKNKYELQWDAHQANLFI